MSTVTELLDKAKKARSLASDNALAIELGVTRQAVSKWRHGESAPDPVTCARLADMVGEPLQRVLGVVGEARAISAAEKAVWRRLASAAAVLLAVFVVALGAGPAKAEKATEMRAESSLCAMRYLARLRHLALSLIWRLHAWTIGHPVPRPA